jgi:signal peptidase I
MQQDSMISRPDKSDTTPEVSSGAKVGGISRKPEGWRGILTTVIILIAAPLMALIVINFVFQTYQVDGESMETTLLNNDRLIVDKIPRTLSKITRHAYIPKRGDIVIFTKTGLIEFGGQPKQLIKRVIGLPGDHVVVSKNKVTIYNTQNPNGFNPDNNSAWANTTKITDGNVDVTVGNTEVFVMGDNRLNSLDSRVFGPLSVNDIIGKLSFRVYPINKFKNF